MTPGDIGRKEKGFISVLCGVSCKLTSSGSGKKVTSFSLKYQVSLERKAIYQ